ncbi:MAG: tetratricopeptide repeat protein [Candidatus Binatia bacterium]
MTGVVVLALLFTACGAMRRLPPAPVPPIVSTAPPRRAALHRTAPSGVPGSSQTSGAQGVHEGELREGPTLNPLPPQEPELLSAVRPGDRSRRERQSLLDRIGPATPPNVAAALRLTEDGRQQLNQGRYDRAMDRFERAVAIDPTNAYGYYFLAQWHYLKKHYDQAITFARRAAALSARVDPVWLARAYSLEGAVFEEAGRYPDARKAYRKAMETDPDNLAARVGVARLGLE